MYQYMDPDLYKAAEEGNIHPFENYQTPLNQLVTPNENTLLHVYLTNQNRLDTIRESKFTDFVDRILIMCPPLLLQANKKGETPLHLAARYGFSSVVKILIDRAKALTADPESRVTKAKKMLRMTNVERDTALHEAARNMMSHVVKILTEEDPKFPYSVNVHGETPLYIAASIAMDVKRQMVTDEILRNCISVDCSGPNGRTALHAAIMNEDDVTAGKMLAKEKKLTKTTDQNGWLPLHYAAYFYSIQTVKVLLEYDASAAYIAETEKKRTPLHIASFQGYVNVMKEIVSSCPTCCELVDNRGWNALHYAVASKRFEVVIECLKIPEFARLETEKDDKGNTPIHLAATVSVAFVDCRKFYKVKDYSERGIFGLNKRNLSVQDIIQENFDETEKKEILESLEDVVSGPLGRKRIVLKEEEEKARSREKEIKDLVYKVSESHLVIAALIATVTFAAAFTVPGGYKNEEGPNQGTAILSKQGAFKAFVISDAIAMVLSISAVFIHFLMPVLRHDKGKITIPLLSWAMRLTMVAMGSMVIAFVTGTYAVLFPSLGLAITTCLVGLSFFFLMCLAFGIIYVSDP